VVFVVPGSNVAAYTTAFGVVFTDVDAPNVTSLSFYDLNGGLLNTFFVPDLAGSETLSFLGVQYTGGEQVGRVRITSGEAPLDSATGDVVAMDDFIYAEPQAIPEPFSMLLVASGLAGVVVRRRLRAEPRPAGGSPLQS
jgi:hypothetical protein